MKVLVCGSRTAKSSKPLYDFLDALVPRPTLIISGTAAGGDIFGEIWAYSRKVPIKRFPADWKRYGKSAGFRRNLEMLDEAEMVVAYWDGQSRGTQHTITEGQKRGLRVEIVDAV